MTPMLATRISDVEAGLQGRPTGAPLDDRLDDALEIIGMARDDALDLAREIAASAVDRPARAIKAALRNAARGDGELDPDLWLRIAPSGLRVDPREAVEIAERLAETARRRLDPEEAFKLLAVLLSPDDAFEEALREDEIPDRLARALETRGALAAVARAALLLAAAAAGHASGNRAEIDARLRQVWERGRPDLGAFGWLGASDASPVDDVGDALRAHLADLRAGLVDLEAAAQAARRMLAGASDVDDLRRVLRRDPVAIALGRAEADPRAMAAAIDAAVKARGSGWPLASIDALRDAGIIDDGLRDDLLWSGVERTVRKPGRSGRLLLPLSVETAFVIDPGGVDHALRIRAMPDAPMAIPDRARPDEAEREALAAFHEQAAGADAAEIAPGGALREPWVRFTGEVGPARAVALLRRFPPGAPLPQAVPEPEEAILARMAAAPTALEFWVARTGGAAERVARTTVDPARLAVVYANAETPRWWNDFDAARAEGLAVEVSLGPRADDIERVMVIGDGGGDGGAHLAALAETGIARALAHGARTNAVGDGPAADDGAEPERWMAALLSPDVTICGTPASAPYGASALFGDVDALAVSLAWCALFAAPDPGSTLDGLTLHDWARKNLRPRGPAQTLAIAGQPYGVLPIAAPPSEDALEPLIAGVHEAAIRAGPAPQPDDGPVLAAALDAGPFGAGRVIALSAAQALSLGEEGWQQANGIVGARPQTLRAADLPVVWPEDDLSGLITLIDRMARDRRTLRLMVTGEVPAPGSLFLRVVIAAFSRLDAMISIEPGEGIARMLANASAPPAGPIAVGRTMLDDLAALHALLSEAQGADALAELEAAFEGCLDAADYRGDAIVTALAHERLTAQGAPRLTLGAYGWVDAPRPADPLAEVPHMHLAPSQVQATAFALMRAGGERPMLASREIRLVLHVAEGLAEGRNVAETLGALAEEYLTDLDPTNAAASVETLRALFPLTGDAGQPPGTDGLAFFSPLSSADVNRDLPVDALEMKTAFANAHPALFAAALGVGERFAELTLLEAVHDAVAARETLMTRLFATAQGESPPDRFEGVAAQSGMRTVTTTVLLAFPEGSGAPVGPAETALGPLAQWCAAAAPGPVRFRLRRGVDTVEFGLADFGLTKADLALIGPEALRVALEERAGNGFTLEDGPGVTAHGAIRRRAELAGTPSTGDGARLPDTLVKDASGPDPRFRALLALAEAGIDDGHSALAWSLSPPLDAAAEALRRRVETARTARGELADLAALLGPEAPMRPFAACDGLTVTTAPIASPDDWLGLMAAVRPNLALADALLLTDSDALELRADAADPFALDLEREALEVTVVLCPPGTDLGGPLHCAVLDSYAEGIADREIAAAAAIRHPPPPARPPAALLMLPPGDWTSEGLRETVEWLDTLARARGVRPEDIADLVSPWTPQRLGAPTPAGPWLWGKQ